MDDDDDEWALFVVDDEGAREVVVGWDVVGVGGVKRPSAAA